MLEAALFCLTAVVYYEARSDPLESQFAVAQVVLNRAARKPERVCDAARAKAQFTGLTKPKGVKEIEAWNHAQAVARLSFYTSDFTGGADHYHHISIYPNWAVDMEVRGQWGAHIFYKDRRKR